MNPTLMLVGLGGLGSTILEFLAREPGIGRIVVASLLRKEGVARCNLARMGAMAQGYTPKIFFLPLDVTDTTAVVETVRRERPDLILSTATLQPWWLPDLLPPEQAAVIWSAGFGVWLPVHMKLTLDLMRGVHAAGYRGITLTAPFPDVINRVLGRLGLAPTSGVGNLDEIVPKVQLLAAERLGAPLEKVRVLLVAHHAVEGLAFAEKEPAGETPPFWVRVEYDGQDVTERVRAKELVLAPYPISPGPAGHFLTAGSTVRLIRALLSTDSQLLHAPGPHGLPGGYPVVVGSGQLQTAALPGLSLDEAIAINERSHRFDGIERIENDGTVVFCPENADILRRELGYECYRLPPDEVPGRAEELMAKFREYAERHGARC